MAYTKELFANNVRTTITGSLSAIATSIVVQTGAGATMPSPNNAIGEFCKMTLQDTATGLRNEIVYVTARTGDVLTVVRGQDGTSGQTWSAGDTIFEGVTANTLDNFTQPTDVQLDSYTFAVASGSTTAYTATFDPVIVALSSGQRLAIDTETVGTNTTSTPTFSPNGLTARTIVKQGGAALVIGDIPNHALLSYDSANARWILLNPVYGTGGLLAKSIQTVTTTGSLTAIDGGLVLINAAGATTQTLPAASALPKGSVVQIMNINTGVGTVQRAGSDTIQVNNSTVSSLALGNGDTLMLLSDGSSKWYAINGTVQLKSSNTFKNGAGYSVFPDGIIIQRGTAAIGVGQGAGAVTFPIAFTSSVESITIGDNATSSAGIQYQGAGSVTTSGFTMWTNTTAGDNPYWIAIGK